MKWDITKAGVTVPAEDTVEAEDTEEGAVLAQAYPNP